MLKVAINGFGRIGRITARQMLSNPAIDIVAINDLTDNATLAHLFKYDSVHGRLSENITSDDDHIYINGKAIRALSERNPENLPWAELDVDIVIESTGIFRTAEKAGMHLTAGAKRVIISAPGKGEGIRSVVLGINDDQISPEDTIFSNASCTTNCSAPMIKVLDEQFGIESGFLSTVHAYTADQNIQDAPHSDLRRARAAATNIVPTSTGAAVALGKIFTHLEGKIEGSALRVPVADGSISEMTLVLKNPATVEQVNAAFAEAAGSSLEGILEYTEDPIVSTDILSNPHSCIFDAKLTKVQGNVVKVSGWYDNEYGYSARLGDLVAKLSQYKLSEV